MGSSHTHSSQHFPGSLTLLGKGQSGLGRRTSMLHSGTQPTAPSRQVHWYLQLLWKDSPLRYTDPPKTQGAPSLAAGEGKKKDVEVKWRVPGIRATICQGGELGSGMQVAGWKQLQTRAFLFLEGIALDLREAVVQHQRVRARHRGLRVLPVHTPILRLAGEPKSQKRPLCGSQGSRSVHNSPSCLAQTRQQPQPSSTRLTPAGQLCATSAAH